MSKTFNKTLQGLWETRVDIPSQPGQPPAQLNVSVQLALVLSTLIRQICKTQHSYLLLLQVIKVIPKFVKCRVL